MSESLARVWEVFLRDMAACDEALRAELWESHRDLEQLLDQMRRALLDEPVPAVDRDHLHSLEAFLAGVGDRLYLERLEQYRRYRPLDRGLSALEDYRDRVEDLVRRLPLSVEAMGSEIASLMERNAPGRWSVQWRKTPVRVPLRAIVERYMRIDSRDKARLEGRYAVAVAKALLLLVDPWQAMFHEAMKGFAGERSDWRYLESVRNRWQLRMRTALKESEASLRALDSWWTRSARRMSGQLASGRGKDSVEVGRATSRRWQECFRYWSRMQRAVAGVLLLGGELHAAAVETIHRSMEALEALSNEHQLLQGEMEQVVDWLRKWKNQPGAEPFPQPQARLASAEDRAHELHRTIETVARLRLPATVETVEPKRFLPGSRSPWRQVEPRYSMLEAWEREGRRVAVEGFGEAEAAHRAIVREIERAREVVTYSCEAAPQDEAAMDAAREAMENALALIEHQQRVSFDPAPAVERKLVEALARLLLVSDLSVAQKRLGLLTYLARTSGSEAAEEARKLVAAWVRTAGRTTARIAKTGSQAFLSRIGWDTPLANGQESVEARTLVSDLLQTAPQERQLPMLYRRLFRLAPVEDPRFLVGREEEMAALAECRTRWEQGRAVSVIIVGERGSGKTSLLNCAEARVFAGLPVVRAEFNQRIADAAAMDRFLEQLPRPAQGRRVVIIEEAERTFLRAMGCFGGIRRLLNIISASQGETMWVLSMNQHAFRLLDAAVGLRSSFSHRINAMSVLPEQLRSAILLRHNLSGLRLQFAPPREADPRVSKLREWLGLQPSPEDLFFDSLYRQSEGVFRAAFELWQQAVERVEGGVLSLQQPVEPDYESLLSEMSEADGYALQAVAQHGSLTPEEFAVVFNLTATDAHSQIERLRALEFLEPEPYAPGLRIRPEAGRVVRMQLYRRNLL